jgi:heptosyltransferase-2/heptosyltransferase-3
LSAARNLRRIGYGSAIIFRPDHWWGAMVAYLAGIPERIGYNLPDTAPFLTNAIPLQHDHAVTQSLRLVEEWTGAIAPQNAFYRFPVDHVDRGYVDGYLQEWGINANHPIICIHPGSGTWVKHWTEEKWAVVGDTLAEQLGAAIVFTGGDHELQLIRRIAASMKQTYCVIAGETHVGQLGALFSRARVVLGPDSGPLHLAAAVGTPTVTLYGPADPVEFGPWGSPQKHHVVTSNIGCRPCRIIDWADDGPENHPCVREISLAQVLDAARRAANSR